MSVAFEDDTILITSAFETGNGKNIQNIGKDHYRLEARGDRAGYNYYFAFQVREKGPVPRMLTVEVVPDPVFSGDPNPDFYENTNTRVWYTRTGVDEEVGWGVFFHLPDFNFRNEGDLEVYRDRYVIRFRTVPGRTVWLTNMYPLPYSIMTKMLKDTAKRYPSLMSMSSLGQSYEKREVCLVDITEGKDRKPAIWVMAGEHPTEFPGQWAVWGIINWLVSDLPDAMDLRRRYRFFIVPQRNPDGNVAGNPQKNAEGIDLNGPPWIDVDRGREPDGVENRFLWKFLQKNPPVANINFHGYPGPRAWGDWPHEGCYVPFEEDFIDEGSRNRQRLLNQYLTWETDAVSQHKRLLTVSRGEFLYTPLARLFGSIGLSYEPLDAKGPGNNMKTGVQVLRAVMKALNRD